LAAVLDWIVYLSVALLVALSMAMTLSMPTYSHSSKLFALGNAPLVFVSFLNWR